MLRGWVCRRIRPISGTIVPHYASSSEKIYQKKKKIKIAIFLLEYHFLSQIFVLPRKLKKKNPPPNESPNLQRSRWKRGAVCEVQSSANGAKEKLLQSQFACKRFPANSLG